MDELLWYVTQRLHQKFLMEQDSTNVEEHKEKLSIINTKISQSEKDLASAKARAEKLDDDYYIEGGMTEAQYKKGFLESSLRYKNLKLLGRTT